MEKSGIILEFNSKGAVVINSEGRFIIIKKKPDMFVGQMVDLQNEDKKMKIPAFVYAAASMAAILLLIFAMRMNLSYSGNTFAYVDIDINPSIELVIDKDYIVLDTRYLNKDAAGLIKKQDLNGLHINSAISLIIDKSTQAGFISDYKDNIVFITASLNLTNNNEKHLSIADEKVLESLLTGIKQDLHTSNKNIQVELLKVTPEVRKSANKNNLSMRKYSIMSEVLEKGIDISLDEIKDSPVSDTLRKVKEIEAPGNSSSSSVANNDEGKPQESRENTTPLHTPTPDESGIQDNNVSLPISGGNSSLQSPHPPTATPASDDENMEPHKGKGPNNNGIPYETPVPNDENANQPQCTQNDADVPDSLPTFRGRADQTPPPFRKGTNLTTPWPLREDTSQTPPPFRTKNPEVTSGDTTTPAPTSTISTSQPSTESTVTPGQGQENRNGKNNNQTSGRDENNASDISEIPID